jgi:hypothetical protein
MGDRFYGTTDLIGWCQDRDWGYRLRLKGNLVVFDSTGKTTTGACAGENVPEKSCSIWKTSTSLANGHAPTSAFSRIRAMLSPEFSPCPTRPATCEPWNTVSVGA